MHKCLGAGLSLETIPLQKVAEGEGGVGGFLKLSGEHGIFVFVFFFLFLIFFPSLNL